MNSEILECQERLLHVVNLTPGIRRADLLASGRRAGYQPRVVAIALGEALRHGQLVEGVDGVRLAASGWRRRLRRCAVCGGQVNAALWAAGDRTHPSCSPDLDGAQ